MESGVPLSKPKMFAHNQDEFNTHMVVAEPPPGVFAKRRGHLVNNFEHCWCHPRIMLLWKQNRPWWVYYHNIERHH